MKTSASNIYFFKRSTSFFFEEIKMEFIQNAKNRLARRLK